MEGGKRVRRAGLKVFVLGALLLVISAAVAGAEINGGSPGGDANPGRDFEVWLVDQSDSFGKTYGGTIHIYEGSDLNGGGASSATATNVLDLGDATADLCVSQTGANPVRPHM